MTQQGQLDPHSGRRITFDVASGPIAALRTGVDGAPDVLLVPGYTGSKEDFVPILDPLATAGFRVTSIDLPGQLDSPGPDDYASYTPAALSTTLLEVVAELDGRPVAARHGNVLVTAFHPELTTDRRLHRRFAQMVAGREEAAA